MTSWPTHRTQITVLGIPNPLSLKREVCHLVKGLVHGAQGIGLEAI